MKNILLLILFVFPLVSFGQTWSDNVAQIVYDKCTKCHHSGGIGPTSLMTYNEVSPMVSAIHAAVSSEWMPPWPPNNNYQQYLHDRSLTPDEKTTILNWITSGAPEGNAANTPPPPVYNSGTLLGNGDLTVQIPTYMSKATALTDDYVCFAIPSGLTQNRTIKSIEIVPGNRQIVHHALIFIDPTGAENTDTLGGNCAGPSNGGTKLIAGYTPGATPMTLPSTAPLKLGIDITAGSNVYFAMHYPVGSYGQFDSTKVIFHFYPVGTTGIRQVSADRIIENWSFSLPPNQTTFVSDQYPNAGSLPGNISLLSVFPHMHLLGQKIKSYGLTAAGDTIKLIDIPQWDFHWQDFYFFKQLQKIPTGGKLKGEGSYFNSTASTVGAGLNTADEMFLVYFHWMLYQNGDENYNMEELLNASLQEQLAPVSSPVSTYPNPFDESTTISIGNAKEGDVVSLYIYDFQGKLIRRLAQNQTVEKEGISVVWDGKSDSGEAVKNGIYFASVRLNDGTYSSRIIKN